ncbi:MAG: serine hydrolase [Alphaproteobacteria bacterium]|nr:serine hydrolase [Alphaproteobacteria bacterium]
MLCGIAADAAADDIAERFPGAEWDHLAPAAAEWSAEQLKAAEDWSGKIGSSAVMVVHHGAIVAEWGDTAARTPLASVRKSLLSALYGMAVERGQIDLKQTVAQLGIDDNEPSLTAEEKTATVRDLLQARSGVYHAALYETPGMAARRPARHSHPPGTFWYYNNWDFNTLGAIYEHTTRHSIFDAFDSEIARPIGMEDYKSSDGQYVTGAASVYPAYPFDMSARDLARFALLYLHKGEWRHRQIVPAAWVEESTKPYSQSGFGPGYAYLWWTGFADNAIAPIVKVPDGTFFAWGYGGQFAFVMPADDLVVIHRAAHQSDIKLRSIGRLLWLVLDAGHFRDIGPDASIAAPRGDRLAGDALKQVLSGKTLRFGDGIENGPIRIRLSEDGGAAALRGAEPAQFDTGTWHVEDDRLCRDWQKTQPLHACWTAVVDGAQIDLFDRNGLMVIAARIEDH